MAIAKKCDRCGKYYESNTNSRTINGSHIVGIRIISEDSWCGFDKGIDLCDDCIEGLHEYIFPNNTDEHKETVTKCDTCEYLFSCEGTIETTKGEDSARHYARSLGGECRKENENGNNN